uniref:Uncharacterized protein n=1 Tax=Rhizophora mucronata TaxID=61149 RepID=A0A2P2NQH6_RHIMU
MDRLASLKAYFPTPESHT